MSQKRKAPWSQPPTTNNQNQNNQYKKPRTKNGTGTHPNKDHESHSHSHSRQNDSPSPSLPAIPPITPALEKAVFTHVGSAAPSHLPHAQQELTYDRLEFLGDAYIEVLATRLIWSLYPHLPAGRMSQLRELLVKNDTLYSFALQYGLDRRIKVQDFHRSDPKRWLKIVADVFEAYVAAVVLGDPVGGFEVVEDWLVQLWQATLDSGAAGAAGIKELTSQPQNLRAKEELARKVMARGIKISYRDEAPMAQRKGGMQTYFIGVYLTGWGWEEKHLGSGTGLSKVAAGNEAALRALADRGVMEEIEGRRKRFLEQIKAEKEGVERKESGENTVGD